MNNREIIEAWLAPLMVEMDCFLVDVRINPSINKYEIFMDSATGVTIEQCTKVSRFVEFQMDNDNRFSEKYSLDVSSPGMENPFKVQQQYDKNIGKTIEVVLLNGNKREGLLKKADGKVLHLEVHHPPKKKGMKPEIELETYGFEEIKSVKKKIVF
jgi:ribosome maturation factor RimP